MALSAHEAEWVTLDGYKAHEILAYHQAVEESHHYTTYKPPTSCVPPLVALNNQLGDLLRADTFERHELSAVFGEIPDDEFQQFKNSIATDGVIENVIKVHEGQILDGWHRYRACRELNQLRLLRFQVWDTEKDGDPFVFVRSRNLDRRHYTPAQRAQIVVHFNKRLGLGANQYTQEGSPNEQPKTIDALQKEAGVGRSTIQRAISVENEGHSKAVILGDKTPGEIEREAKAKRYAKLCKAINAFNRVYQKSKLHNVSVSEVFFPAAAEALEFPASTVDRVYQCQETPEYEERRSRLFFSIWEEHFEKMKTAIVDEDAWIDKCIASAESDLSEALIDQITADVTAFRTPLRRTLPERHHLPRRYVHRGHYRIQPAQRGHRDHT